MSLDLIAAANDVLAWLRESFDDTAHRFYLETGNVAPGKDVPERMIGQGDLESRRELFFAWCRKRRARFVAALEAGITSAEGDGR